MANFSEPQFSHLQIKNKTNYLEELFRGYKYYSLWGMVNTEKMLAVVIYIKLASSLQKSYTKTLLFKNLYLFLLSCINT